MLSTLSWRANVGPHEWSKVEVGLMALMRFEAVSILLVLNGGKGWLIVWLDGLIVETDVSL